MSKFVEMLDEDGDRVIINLERISHVLRLPPNVTIYFEDDCTSILRGEYADIFWRYISASATKLNLHHEPSQDAEKEVSFESDNEAKGASALYNSASEAWNVEQGSLKKKE